MKFLLTSAGLMNESISNALVELTGMQNKDINVVFIPTAANLEPGDMEWLIKDYTLFSRQGFNSIDIIDIAAVGKDVWQPRLEAAHIFCFGGGNEQFLARVINESGLKEILPQLLATRVYMGISAGSMVVAQFPTAPILKAVYPEDKFENKLQPSLGLVGLHFIPHLNSDWFPNVRKEIIEKIQDLSYPLYALDDQSALKIVDNKIEVVTEGEYIKI
jgi:dipeptidase E